MLYALEVPVDNGVVLGDTLFSSAADAHDALPQKTTIKLTDKPRSKTRLDQD